MRFGKVVYQDGSKSRAIKGKIRFEEGFIVIETRQGEIWVETGHVHNIKYLHGGRAP
jgi:hypothetical protein